MEIRNVIAVAALVAAGLAIQAFILAEVVARPLAVAVANAQRAGEAPEPGDRGESRAALAEGAAPPAAAPRDAALERASADVGGADAADDGSGPRASPPETARR